jgi:hypothetical protein
MSAALEIFNHALWAIALAAVCRVAVLLFYADDHLKADYFIRRGRKGDWRKDHRDGPLVCDYSDQGLAFLARATWWKRLFLCAFAGLVFVGCLRNAFGT